MVLLLFLLASSCTTTKNATRPTNTDYLTLQNQNQHFHYLFVGKYLWLFYDRPSKILIINQAGQKEISYEDLPIFPCTHHKDITPNASRITSETLKGYQLVNPKCKAFPDQIFRSIRSKVGSVLQGVRIEDENVLINLDRDKVYTFKANGELIKFEKESFVNDWPRLGWKVNEKGDLSYKGKTFKTAWHFRFSGPLVATYDHTLKEVSLFDVRSGKLIEVFPKLRGGPKLIETNDGFYFSKGGCNIKWYGKSVIDLHAEKNNFCYAFEGKKKCIDNIDGKLRRVTESTHFRTYLGEWNDLYIEFKSPTP